ncbi:MAG: IS701 family transposase [Polyangiaceae bacterium]
MAYELCRDAQDRLRRYFDTIGEALGSESCRGSFAMYALGLLSESERKSIEPIAARAIGSARHASAEHQRLHHFIANMKWSDRAVRDAAATYATTAMQKMEPIVAWIIDDTGFLKQGKHSVGVQRQYTGSAGKTANCQVGVSLTVATRTMQVPIDFELFLPKSWMEDASRRQEAKIPEELTFKTKIDLALEMIERAALRRIAGKVVLADSFYGHSGPFRDAIHLMGFDYGMAIFASDRMWRLRTDERRKGELLSAKQIALSLPKKKYRVCAWRDGTNAKLSSRFAICRVKVPRDPDTHLRAEWLLIEWPKGKPEPTHFALTTLPRRMSKKQIVRLVKERYKTERVYEELKGELGLDHFEGRGFRGWHHHVSVVLCCYAYLVAERAQACPPAPRRESEARPLLLAA